MSEPTPPQHLPAPKNIRETFNGAGLDVSLAVTRQDGEPLKDEDRQAVAAVTSVVEAADAAVSNQRAASAATKAAIVETPRLPEPAPPPQRPVESLAYDDFLQLDLRVGVIQAAARLPKKDKLLDLQVDIGEKQPRRIIAGLGKAFQPEDLVGARVIVVANLAPRDFGKGVVSHGMILAASPDESQPGLSLATVATGPAGMKVG